MRNKRKVIDKELLRAHLDAGMSEAEIAALVGVTPASLRRSVRQIAPVAVSTHAGLVARKAELEQLWADRDLTLEDIAARLGLSVAVLRGRAWRYGIGRRSGGKGRRPTPIPPQLEATWHQPGLKVDEVAEVLGISVHVLERMVRQLGLPPHNIAVRQPARQKRTSVPPKGTCEAEVTDPILATGGRYRDLAQIAARRGVSLTNVTLAYHKARAEARRSATTSGGAQA